jgi:histone deacetylase 1/2
LWVIRRRGGGRSGKDRDRDLVTCQICGKQRHKTWKCWHRYSEDDEEEEEKGANAVSYGVDTNWYSDTGATDHITGELNKLTMKEKYTGLEQIHAANGQGMSIRHVGHAIVDTPSKSLHLKNVLHVPHVTKNLVSVHRFTKDNHVFIEFHPWYFYVKDQATKKVLLKGRCLRGLYPLIS